VVVELPTFCSVFFTPQMKEKAAGEFSLARRASQQGNNKLKAESK